MGGHIQTSPLIYFVLGTRQSWAFPQRPHRLPPEAFALSPFVGEVCRPLTLHGDKTPITMPRKTASPPSGLRGQPPHPLPALHALPSPHPSPARVHTRFWTQVWVFTSFFVVLSTEPQACSGSLLLSLEFGCIVGGLGTCKPALGFCWEVPPREITASPLGIGHANPL